MSSDRPLTVVHVSHEATEKVGGIGTVLEGLLTAGPYTQRVGRSILVAPLFVKGDIDDPLRRLGPDATRIRYSGPDGLDPEGLGAILRPIEWAFGTPIVYGERAVRAELDGGHEVTAEALVVDVSNPNQDRLRDFKRRLELSFDLHSSRYDSSWDFEEYCRLAEPAWHALLALLGPEELPAVLISHEYMGLCTALRAAMDPQRRFRTVFHAHECTTARRLVENHPGHDCAFYPAMRRARRAGQHLTSIFGDQSWNGRHALVSLAHRLDITLAVGEPTEEELRFLSREMDGANMVVCPNGVPCDPITLDQKKRARGLLDQWLKGLLGRAPDYLFTHVTRPVISKGLWRDLRVCAHMEQALRARGQTAVCLLLTSGAPQRTADDVARLTDHCNWPAEHHVGWPDVVGIEMQPWRDIQAFNNPGRAGGGAITAMLVNQFGFESSLLGPKAPAGITIATLREAADVEFGQSIYEPFGIAQLEPLDAGAICVPSSVCGCISFLRIALEQMGVAEGDFQNLIVADYASMPSDNPLAVGQEERDAHENEVASRVARTLLERLPRTDEDRARLLAQGQRAAEMLSWRRVCEDHFLPALDSILSPGPRGASGTGARLSRRPATGRTT